LTKEGQPWGGKKPGDLKEKNLQECFGEKGTVLNFSKKKKKKATLTLVLIMDNQETRKKRKEESVTGGAIDDKKTTPRSMGKKGLGSTMCMTLCRISNGWTEKSPKEPILSKTLTTEETVENRSPMGHKSNLLSLKNWGGGKTGSMQTVNWGKKPETHSRENWGKGSGEKS